MGRKGSRLIPFLEEALFERKYWNLKYENVSLRVFSLILPQKTLNLEESCQFILKDWYQLTERPYEFKIDYTPAKQGMEAALRKSDFLVPCKLQDDKKLKGRRKVKLVYRILNKEEVREYKLRKKVTKNLLKMEPLQFIDSVPSPDSSGYGSGSDNAEEMHDENHALLHAFRHDHKYEHTSGYCPLEIMDPSYLNYEDEPPPLSNEVTNGDPMILDHWKQSYFPPDQHEDMLLIDSIFNSGIPDSSAFNEINHVLNNLLAQYPSFLKQEPEMEQIDFDLFDEDTVSCNDSQEFEENMKSLNEIVEKFDVGNQTQNSFIAAKNEPVKVYECLHRQDLPKMIILTCEPKMKEIFESSVSDGVNEESFPKFIFDEETMKLMSSCVLQGIQTLPNDHVLVFLQCKELDYSYPNADRT